MVYIVKRQINCSVELSVRSSRVKVQFLKGDSKQSFGIYVYNNSKQIFLVMVGTSVVITSVCVFNCLCKNSWRRRGQVWARRNPRPLLLILLIVCRTAGQDSDSLIQYIRTYIYHISINLPQTTQQDYHSPSDYSIIKLMGQTTWWQCNAIL